MFQKNTMERFLDCTFNTFSTTMPQQIFISLGQGSTFASHGFFPYLRQLTTLKLTENAYLHRQAVVKKYLISILKAQSLMNVYGFFGTYIKNKYFMQIFSALSVALTILVTLGQCISAAFGLKSVSGKGLVKYVWSMGNTQIFCLRE